MRPFRLFLAAACAATSVVTLAASPVGHADSYTFSGTLVDANGGAPIGGRVVTFSAPAGGPVVSVITAANGSWSFTSATDEFDMFVNGGTSYQSGHRTCGGHLTPAIADACTIGPAAGLVTQAFASFVSGRIVDSITGAGVPNAIVKVYAVDAITLLGSAITDVKGNYRINGIAGDEVMLYVNGAAASHATGWFGCVSIVATPGAACSWAPGHQGTRRLARVFIRSPFAFPLVLATAGH